jgi:UDPglucose 6-dehydrogenase
LALIRVLGLGYVGLTTAIGLANLGHTIEGFDVNPNTVKRLRGGTSPIFEPGLEEQLKRHLESKKISFHEILENVKSEPDFFFVCVPTPSSETGESDLSYVREAIESALAWSQAGAIVVMKSTVPIGTGRELHSEVQAWGGSVVSNPEFLREGSALNDFMMPDRIVVGSENQDAASKVMALYESINCPKILTSSSAAELIKYAANAYLALRISFVNDMARLSDSVGVEAKDVMQGISHDQRIGPQFLNPGPGWGGSCFPKDTKELVARAHSRGIQIPTVTAAIDSNEKALQHVVEQITQALDGTISGSTISVWGLAFKAGTDDIRESPAVKIVELLAKMGANVVSFDPIVRSIGDSNINIVSSPQESCVDSDLLVVMTEWQEFRDIDPESALGKMRARRVIDARGILERASWATQSSFFWSINQGEYL